MFGGLVCDAFGKPIEHNEGDFEHLFEGKPVADLMQEQRDRINKHPISLCFLASVQCLCYDLCLEAEANV